MKSRKLLLCRVSLLVALFVGACPAGADYKETCTIVESAGEHSEGQGGIIDDVTDGIEVADPVRDISVEAERCIENHVAKIPVPSLSGILGSLGDLLGGIGCDFDVDLASSQAGGDPMVLSNNEGRTLDASGNYILDSLR